MSACSQCSVRNRAICAALSDEERALLSGMGHQQTVRAGEALLWEGDESLRVANVIEGVLTLSTGTQDGREQIVGVVYPADFIGRPFGTRTAQTVTALTDARVCTFARSDFDRFAREHPALEHRLLQTTLTELDRAREWMLLLGRKSAEGRVASFLLDMADRLACERTPAAASKMEPAGDAFTLPFGRQQIADILGLTIETVSRQLTRLRSDGVIDLPARRDIVIRDRAALEALAA